MKAVALTGFLLFTATAASAQGTPRLRAAARQSHAVRTIESAGAVEATLKKGSHCQAFAPASWRVVGSRPSGDAFDLMSADGRIYAGWGIRGVNRAMEAFYGPMHADPATSSLAVAGAVLQAMGSGHAPRYLGVAQQLGSGFVARGFGSATHEGIVVYRVYPPPPGLAGGSYIISLRIAAAEKRTWAAEGKRIAVGVAASINCTTMLQAPRGGDADLPRPGDPRDRRARGGETDDLADYNAQLGTQWVRSESTGERYMVDHAAAWNENGPDGPGYYRKVGTDYEKLTPGWGN